MNVLSIDRISKSFNEKTLFEEATFGIDQGQKIALVGVNGCGKSTLLKMIAKIESPDSGDISYNKSTKVSYLPQIPKLEDANDILSEIFNSANESAVAVMKYQLLLVKSAENPAFQEELQSAIEKVDNLNAWDFEDKARQVLGKLGIHDTSQQVSGLSGGQRKRVALAKVLLEEPDLLILDEPTNHLDLEAIEWLENFLDTANLSLLMVTHDRYFLDKVTNHIIEIDQGQIFRYYGNYAYFLEKKSEREQREAIEIDKARNLMKKELEWIRRQPKARGTKAKYRIDAFYDLKEKATKNVKKEELDIQTGMSRLGKKVLEIEEMDFAYGDKVITKNFNYIFKRKERIGIVGANGAGKSTFLNLLTKKISPDKGEVKAGINTRFGYYTQSELEAKPGQKVIEVIKEIAEFIKLDDGREISASQLLTLFLFDGKAQYNYVERLSGGERRRLQLLKVLMGNPNFLILDEPTNDLDIMTLNILEDYLENFDGCLMIVSHDRYFMDRLADHLFVFEGDGVIRDFNGNYTDYRQEFKNVSQPKENKPIDPEERVNNQQPKDRNKAKLSFKEKRELEAIEAEMPELEKKKAELIDQLNHRTADHEKLMEISKEIETISEKLEEIEFRWLELSEKS